MNHVKIFGLAAIAAVGLMALAGSASATVLKHNGVNMSVNEELNASVTKSVMLATTGGATISTCTEGFIESSIGLAGGPFSTVSSHISLSLGWTWGSCSTTIESLKGSDLEIHHISGTNDGTVTSRFAEFTVNVGGISCTYGTGTGTDIGTLTGGSPAVLDFNAILAKVAGSFLCPTDAVASGQYTITSPSGTLDVAAS